MMKRIVVTGATGFIGGALVREMVARGHQVYALARREAGRDRLADLPVIWHSGDILRPSTLKGLFAGADGVIHAAGMLGQAGVPEADYQAIHVAGTEHVLTAVAAQAPHARVLHISSPGVLGPIDGPAADETHPLAPSNPYERSKAAAEEVVHTFTAQGLDVVIARPEFVYGPGDLHVLGLFQAVKRGLFFYIDGGSYECHPTFIDDAVTGMAACLENGRFGQIYHITGPTPVSFRTLGQTIAAGLAVRPPWLSLPRPVAMLAALSLEAVGSITGKQPPLSRTGVAFFSENRRFDFSRAQQELGFRPGVDLTEGVARTIAWYRQQNLL